MINNLINYNFYDITKQWNCADVFFAALKLYTIQTAMIEKELAADKAEASKTYMQAYTALYRQSVEKEYEIQKQFLDDQISAGKNLNNSLWSASGTANAMLFDSAKANDPIPDILTYLRAQSKAEVAAMVASAELYGEFQVSWRSEMLALHSTSLQDNSNDNDVRLSAVENDIEWAQKVSAARNAYYSALGTATSEYNNSIFDALEAYNTVMLNAEIARAKAHFDAAESYSKNSYDLEVKYTKKQFETNKKYSLAAIDAAIVQMVGLAELDAYFARKIADEYGAITVEDDYGAVINQIYYDNYLESSQKRQEINDTKIAADKTLAKQEKRETNNNYVDYFVKGLLQKTTYVAATVATEVTYYSTVIIVGILYDTTVTKAEKTFDENYCQLTERYYDALQIIDSGGTIDANFYENGTSSLNVQVCFPAGTPVILANGTTKNIENILPGDLVQVPDQNDPEGTKQVCKVVEIYHNAPQLVLRLKFKVASDNSEFIIRATIGHRFYVRNIGWQHASDISIGSELLNGKNDSIILLEKELESEPVPVYNFQVENAHTYFVGENVGCCILSHNQNCELHSVDDIYKRKVDIINGHEYLEPEFLWARRVIQLSVENELDKSKLRGRGLDTVNATHNILINSVINATRYGVPQKALPDAIKNVDLYNGWLMTFGIHPPQHAHPENLISEAEKRVKEELKNSNIQIKNWDHQKLSNATIETIFSLMDDALKAEVVRQTTLNPFNSNPIRNNVGPKPIRPNQPFIRPIQIPIIRGK
jgi:hypothetical protein